MHVYAPLVAEVARDSRASSVKRGKTRRAKFFSGCSSLCAERRAISCSSTARRAGSTLCSNILRSDPRICGFGEIITIYLSSANLSELAAKVHWVKPQLPTRERYVQDERYVQEKIAHNRLLLHPEVLDNAEIYWFTCCTILRLRCLVPSNTGSGRKRRL